MARPTLLSINLEAISANLELARSLAPGSKLMACVKANAYGHGMLQVARRIAPRVDALGVACLEEAQQLREAGIQQPVLLLEGCFSAEELKLADKLGCWQVIHNEGQLESFLREASGPANLWIKLDTGMHRLGFPAAALPGVVRKLEETGQHNLHLMTHFACADETDNSYTSFQVEQFNRVTSGLSYPKSMANSAALLAWDTARADWNRPGFMLYGVNPLDTNNKHTAQLQPAMTLTSEVVAVRTIAAGEGVGYNHAWRAARESTIAIVACGYGDGYPRQVRNGTPVLVNGRRAGTVGHVAMDMMSLDVTDIGEVKPGDPVELWGENLSIAEVARHSDMSPYELMTRLPPRPARRYLGG